MGEKIAGKVRESNIELLRIVMMLVIVLHHYIVNSGITDVINASVVSGAPGTPPGGGVLLYSASSGVGRQDRD